MQIRVTGLLLLLLFSLPHVAQALLPEQVSTKGIGFPGETEVFGHINSLRFYGANDISGNTDKLVTQTGSFSYGQTFKSYSYVVGWDRIFITPIFKTKFKEPQLTPPLADRLGDYRQYFFSQSYTIPMGKWGLRLQGTVLHIDSRDHGTAALQERLHELIGSPFELDGYEPAMKQQTAGASAIELLFPPVKFLWAHWGVGIGASNTNNYYFSENSTFATLVIKFSSKAILYAKYAQVTQNGSSFFQEEFAPSREQVSLGIKVHKYFFPHISRVTTYINDDRVGQIYANPFNFAYEF